MSGLEVSNITHNQKMVTQKQAQVKLGRKNDTILERIFGTSGAIGGFCLGAGWEAAALHDMKFGYDLGLNKDKLSKVVAESTLLRRSAAILGGFFAAGVLGCAMYKIASYYNRKAHTPAY